MVPNQLSIEGMTVLSSYPALKSVVTIMKPVSGWTRVLRALVSVAVNDAGTEGQGCDEGGAGKAAGRRQ